MSLLVNIVSILAFVTLFIFVIMAAIPIISNKGIWHPRCHSKRKLKGKTTLITGASAGIGKETARDFAARGARVIMACRNLSKAKFVADDIISSTGNKNVVVYELDTSSMKSVRKCAAEVLKKETRLDILVNNAGIGGHTKRVLTEDGFELTMATNHYGHFLLTNLLLGLIKNTSHARIVTVSSELHSKCRSLDTQDLKFKNVAKFGQLASYAQSKLCNVLFTFELARILSRTGVKVNCVHPGLVGTEIFGKSNIWMMPFNYAAYLTAKTEEEGAQTTIYAAVSEETENTTGKYYAGCREKNSSNLSQNVDLARKLWDESVKSVKLRPQEVHY